MGHYWRTSPAPSACTVHDVREAIEPTRLAPRDRGPRPDVDVGTVVELYMAGMTIQRIAARLRCNQRTVEHRLAVAGVPRRSRWRSTPDVDAQIALRYRAGQTQAVIAGALGCTPRTVGVALDRMGVERRGWRLKRALPAFTVTRR
jgi:DNA-binding CsgD family transcriptional regulator